jgi:osmotically-inducible protein OsmY
MQPIVRIVTITLTLLVLQAGLSSCAAVMVGGAVAGAYYLGKDERTAHQIADDANITANVKAALLANDHVKAWNINVDTYENVVTLHGYVENQAEYKLAQEIAGSIKGVESVDSKLAVIKVEVEDRSL